MIRIFLLSVLILNTLSCVKMPVVRQNTADLLASNQIGATQDCESLTNMSFLIVSNELRSDNLRHIQIFMINVDFSLENLKKLFSNLSNRFRSPKYLTIVVYTDWSQLDLPTDCERIGSSKKNVNGDKNEFLWGVFNRHEQKKTIRYTKTANADHLETVIVE